MRRAVIIVVLALLVLTSMIIWMINSGSSFELKGILMIGIQVVLVIFASIVVYRRMKSARQKMPAEDEMSKSITRRGAASSYYVSIYMWLALMLFEDRIKLEGHSLIGAGILGMALIYGLSWIYHMYIKPSDD